MCQYRLNSSYNNTANFQKTGYDVRQFCSLNLMVASVQCFKPSNARCINRVFTSGTYG